MIDTFYMVFSFQALKLFSKIAKLPENSKNSCCVGFFFKKNKKKSSSSVDWASQQAEESPERKEIDKATQTQNPTN